MTLNITQIEFAHQFTLSDERRMDIHKNGRIEVKLSFSDDILRLAEELHAAEAVKTAVPGGF